MSLERSFLLCPPKPGELFKVINNLCVVFPVIKNDKERWVNDNKRAAYFIDVGTVLMFVDYFPAHPGFQWIVLHEESLYYVENFYIEPLI